MDGRPPPCTWRHGVRPSRPLISHARQRGHPTIVLFDVANDCVLSAYGHARCDTKTSPALEPASRTECAACRPPQCRVEKRFLPVNPGHPRKPGAATPWMTVAALTVPGGGVSGPPAGSWAPLLPAPAPRRNSDVVRHHTFWPGRPGAALRPNRITRLEQLRTSVWPRIFC